MFLKDGVTLYKKIVYALWFWKWIETIMSALQNKKKNIFHITPQITIILWYIDKIGIFTYMNNTALSQLKLSMSSSPNLAIWSKSKEY